MRSKCLAFLCCVVLVGLGAAPASALVAPRLQAAGGEPAPAHAGPSVGGKLSPGLAAATASAPKEPMWALVVSSRKLAALPGLTLAHAFVWPDGTHAALVRGSAHHAAALAARPEVLAVRSAAPVPETAIEPDRGVRLPPPPDPALRRRALQAAAPWSPAAPAAHRTLGRSGGGADPAPQGWFDVRAGHAAAEAWAMGYRGEGVRVAVLDNAVDFAHPDLLGTWAVLPAGHPYEGWPQAFDPNVGLQTIQDRFAPPFARSSRTARSGRVELYQTSAVTPTSAAGATVHTACFQPGRFGRAIGDFALGPADCGYVVPDTSKGGSVRYGHHPDASLRVYVELGDGAEGEWVGMLLVDEATAGDFDTLYVDVDGDHDFTDEKPMTRESPAGWRDVTGDGLADVSAGLLYWISDGALPFPASWVWGLEAEIPEAGRFVGILWAGGSHGTLCASNVASQGVLKVPPERLLRFRDLPEGNPPSTNAGLAPDAAVVSVGDVYTSDAMFSIAWRYSVLGHEPGRPDDDIQVVSNSYGFSDVDNDGWDPDSRQIDALVRRANPTVSFLVATGNGAPGYGTVTAPKPAVALGIGASTQMGSTGSDIRARALDSITDTAQITFGDIIPWSNRGPGADGSVGVALAADGAEASGGVPVNTAGDGAHANGTWDGTSRATPVAAGAMALVYEAYRARTGDWPTWQEARSILMAGARYNAYDPLTTGAGVLDAGDAVRIAAGKRGLHASPAEWVAGDYRGETHPAFAALAMPGEAYTTTVTLRNPTDRDVRARLGARTPRRIGSVDTELVTRPEDESPPSDVPDYLMALDRAEIPADTELMVARAAFPLEVFDADGDYSPDSALAMAVLQHTDIDGDGRLWADRDDDGVVDHRQLPGAYVRWSSGTDGGEAPAVEGFWITRPLGPEGVTADLASFGTGCGPQEGADVTGRIALIARGMCPFRDKLASAQRAGAVGAIVFSDERPAAIMFALPSGLTIPALMIDGRSGEALRERMDAGDEVRATMGVRHWIGLDGAAPIVWEDTEIQQYEYMRFSADGSARNHFAVSVHHPLERWADGLYLAFWNSDPATELGAAVMRDPNRLEESDEGPAAAGLDATAAISATRIAIRLDFYAYEPWDALTLSEDEVIVPANGSVDVEARLAVPPGASPGLWQGAVFVDYPRDGRPSVYLPVLANKVAVGGAGLQEPARPLGGAGHATNADAEAPLLPGGYELPHLRTVVPVVANIGAAPDWRTATVLGGPEARDADAPYDNGATWGAFTWDWRAESGDWRFFFLDALDVPERTHWLVRTTWQDAASRSSDIDTRLYGPADDAYGSGDPESGVEPDPDWYGPHTLALVARSPYLVFDGSVWPFDTSSGGAEDWVAGPVSRAGLHALLLHNVLFGGHDFALPFSAEIGSVQLSGGDVSLVGDACAALALTPTLGLEDLSVQAFGLSLPEVLADVPVAQDDPDDPTSAGFRHDVTLATRAGRFVVALEGEEDDDLDLWVLRDHDGDGTFAYPDEVVGEGTTPTASERIELGGFPEAGAYQVWVLGWDVQGEGSTFDLTIDVVSGDSLRASRAPDRIGAGETGAVEVCADTAALEGEDGPASGLLVIGPAAAPALLRLPVTWRREP